MRQKFAAGNWKMNGLVADLDILQEITETPCDIARVICLPATLLMAARDVTKGTNISLGAQNCHAAPAGAHTGDISAKMLVDAGASYVILGHSERRMDHGETDTKIRAKITAASDAGLTPILCVGESLDDRESGKAVDIVAAQVLASLPVTLKTDLVIAYEPIWAIGTGKIPSLSEIEEIHMVIRDTFSERYGAVQADRLPILYGGSVKPDNAADIFAIHGVDGALIGGASLQAASFNAIAATLDAA